MRGPLNRGRLKIPRTLSAAATRATAARARWPHTLSPYRALISRLLFQTTDVLFVGVYFLFWGEGDSFLQHRFRPPAQKKGAISSPTKTSAEEAGAPVRGVVVRPIASRGE